MTNCDANGVRYSVFSFNDLADWCNEDLWYGSQARDLSYEHALQELRAEAHSKFDDLLEQAEIAAAEVDSGMSDAEREKFVESWFVEHEVLTDREDFVGYFVERNADNIQIDEPTVEGTLDGIEYRISWLGGAPLLWIIKGLPGTGEQLCSPCVPGAVDGGGGFLLDSENAEFNGQPDFEPTRGYRCHCPPRDWVRA